MNQRMNQYIRTNKRIKGLLKIALFISLKKSFPQSFFAAVRCRVLKLMLVEVFQPWRLIER